MRDSSTVKRDVIAAFGLVLMAFLVFLGYLFPDISSFFQLRQATDIILFTAFLIAIFGFIMIWKIMISLMKVNRGGQRLKMGAYEGRIPIYSGKELGELGETLSRMTRRIKENMEELKVFSERTEKINEEINKRILALSGLLQISSLISQNVDLDKIITLSIEKCLTAGEMSTGCLILQDKESKKYELKAMHGFSDAEGLQDAIQPFFLKSEDSIFTPVLTKGDIVIIDNDTLLSKPIEEFQQIFRVINAIILPIIVQRQVRGILIIGNNKEQYKCSPTDKEVLMLLAQQISIAIENEMLASRITKLEVKDNLTGLYNRKYALERLEEEVKRAVRFQRPCSFALLSIDNFRHYHECFGRIEAENALIKISTVIKDNISEIDKAARFGDHTFALILPEKNKRQCIEIADEVRRKVEFIFSTEEEKERHLTCTGSVTENPIDGMTAQELVDKAEEILSETIKQGGNKVYYKI